MVSMGVPSSTVPAARARRGSGLNLPTARTGVLGLGPGSVTAQNVVGALGWVVTDPKAGLIDAVLHEYDKKSHVARIWPLRASDLDWPTTVLRPSGYRRLVQPLHAIDLC